MKTRANPHAVKRNSTIEITILFFHAKRSDCFYGIKDPVVSHIEPRSRLAGVHLPAAATLVWNRLSFVAGFPLWRDCGMSRDFSFIIFFGARSRVKRLLSSASRTHWQNAVAALRIDLHTLVYLPW
jgi:hypothetical protein